MSSLTHALSFWCWYQHRRWMETFVCSRRESSSYSAGLEEQALYSLTSRKNDTSSTGRTKGRRSNRDRSWSALTSLRLHVDLGSGCRRMRSVILPYDIALKSSNGRISYVCRIQKRQGYQSEFCALFLMKSKTNEIYHVWLNVIVHSGLIYYLLNTWREHHNR